MLDQDSNYSLSEADKAELNKLVSVLELSSGTTIIFAIAPESSPQHPVVKQLKESLAIREEQFEFTNFYYSQNSFHNFLYSLDDQQHQSLETGRKLVMAFGIDQLPTPRLVKEMRQLNLGREELFGRNLCLILWLNNIDFLDEFRQRAPDFWDWRGKIVEFETRNPLLYPYLDWLIAENSYLKMSGVMQVNRQVDIFLDQIYVSLQAQWRQQVTDTSERSQRELEALTVRQAPSSNRLKEMGSNLDDWDEPYYYEPLPEVPISTLVSSTKTVTQKVDLSEAVRQNCYSVILGSPGAGKTTLLRYLALHFAIAKRDELETVIVEDDTVEETKNKDLGKTLLPIFFRIADYAEKLKQQPELTLLEYLCQFYRQWEAHFQSELEIGNEVAALLLDAMRQGQCLMLLDGLDEVFDQESRKQIVERINTFVDEFPSNKFVITSRIAGYSDVKLSSRFAEFTIEDMDSEQVERFLYRWCRTVEKAQQPDASEEQWLKKGTEQAQEILQAVKDNPGVQRLTANPLLLTILALIHRNGERLPNRRVKLYELAVQTLTEDWQLGKKLPDAPRVVLKETEVVELLAPLAYWMHEEKPSGLVTQAEVEEKLAAKLAELNDAEPESDSVRQAVGEFLRKVRETTGLFVERMPGFYGFMHLTFEEYFAARYIADKEQSEILELIQKHLHEPRWNEPLLLALGYYGSHFSTQFKKLAEKLFINIEDYQPVLQHGEIKIKISASDDETIVYLKHDESANKLQPAEFKLGNLLFAGQVIAEIEINSIVIRQKPIKKLVITYLGIDADFEDDITKQILRLLRKIELFCQKGEVIDLLKQAANNSNLSEEIRVKAKAAILYIACGELTGLADCVTEIVNQLEPTLFCSMRELVKELGDDMTPNLEHTRQHYHLDEDCQTALNFLTAMSYLRKDKYDKAIEMLELLTNSSDSRFSAYIAWSLATCYQEKEAFEQAVSYYQECFEKLARYIEPSEFLIFWRNRGVCHRLHGKYEQALDCFQRMLTISREINKPQDESLALYHIGRTYQDWSKYEQAINYHQQSCELYQQLGKDNSVANQWDWLAVCYREWGKYEQAIECENQELAIRQQLDDQVKVARAYWRLGRIYQSWGRYEQAINYYQQSRNLYQQLGKDKDVANQWFWLGDCYRKWGKYERATEYENQGLVICQKLDDQVIITQSYSRLGGIYRNWGKYEQAINYYQQSRELYQQLGKDKDVADLLYWLGECYREWSKYQQAVEYQSQCLAMCQQLDNKVDAAKAYWQLGRIYQNWVKYEQAINYYQQSRDLYQQLGKDKDVADLWYWLGDCYREWGKYQQAIEYENQDLAIRQQIDDQVNIALSYWRLGRIYQNWGRYEQAINYYQQSRDLYQQLGKDKDVANQWFWLGDCYREWGKYQQAIEYENQDLAIRQQIDDQVNIALSYWRLGRIYQNWGRYEQAINYYQQSRDLYQQLGKDKDVADLWYWLAVCYREWGKYQQAIEYENQDLAIRQQIDDQVNIALSYWRLGRIYQNWGRYEQAINYYQQSRDLYQQLGKDKDVADLWYWLGDCYREWGKYQQAIECENQDLAIRQQIDDQVNIALSYWRLGRIYQNWGRYEQAINYYQQSRDIYQQLGKDKDVANQWYWLAVCYREWGKYQQAIEYENQDLAIRQQIDDQVNIALSYWRLGRIYQNWGRYEQAINYYQQSRDLYQQLGKDKDIADLWYWLGDCYREWGKYQQAIECENQDLVIRQQLDDQVNIADAYYKLGRIYQTWGKYEQAINYYQQSHDIYQQLSKDKNIANLFFWLAYCYSEWGKYERAIECNNQDLAIRQQIDDQVNVALVYVQLGWIYQEWGKYEQAISYFQQSRELYQQLGKDNNVAMLWYGLGDYYREWGKYEQAIECGNQCLAICQHLDNQLEIALTYYQLGSIYQNWGKYEQAINYHQQSRELYQQLGKDNNVANQWYWLASCYRDLKDYTKAIEHCQQSLTLHQQLDQKESVARRYRQLASCQCLFAKQVSNSIEVSNLLTQAEENIRQAIEINTTGEYQESLAYDYTALGLLYSQYLRLLPNEDTSIPEKFALFEEYYHRGLSYLDELGQTVSKAEESLGMARAYLEIEALENLNLSEEIAQECLQIFQDYNRHKLEASAYKLLGEIYLKRIQKNQPDAEIVANQFLNNSLQLYRDLDLQEKAREVEELILLLNAESR
ncbi:tetratricopeptide repeat protein [Nostoc sp. FACHB-280]|uniref:tetratricopeptide repeat protein n=1 Tax=Nostoc sp. FACHB-280 TaxID=2692839 RepID=UPI00168AA818|nr:tetratricopeptide repeat protein [Nostoc sp. FACHB-280]MBD2495589.1 tetratricopeptide repeat protein [Nostoc sp. FACHB-280]